MPYQSYYYQNPEVYQKSRLNSAIAKWRPSGWDTFFSGAELAPKVLKGEDVRGEEILHTFARNVGLFTGLKTIGKLQNKFWQEAEKVFDEIPSDKSKKSK